MRFDPPKSIKESLKNYLDKFPHKKKLRQGMVLSAFKDVVGNRIASQVSDLHFESDKLVVKVSNQVWRHEIHANRFSIAKKLNAKVKSQVVGEIIVRS